MRSPLLLHKQNVVGPELRRVRKWVSWKKVDFQISGVSSICVHLTLDPGTSHRGSPGPLSISEVHRIGQVCAESEGLAQASVETDLGLLTPSSPT